MNEFLKLLFEPFAMLIYSWFYKHDLYILHDSCKKENKISVIILGCVNHYYSAGISRFAIINEYFVLLSVLSSFDTVYSLLFI